MGSADHQNFDDRLRKIDQRHRTLARGYVTRVGPDGLVIAEPRPRAIRFPWRTMFLLLVVTMTLKGFLHSQIGAADYDARVAKLTTGTTVEQLGAWIMTADPATEWVSAQFSAYLPG